MQPSVTVAYTTLNYPGTIHSFQDVLVISLIISHLGISLFMCMNVILFLIILDEIVITPKMQLKGPA